MTVKAPKLDIAFASEDASEIVVAYNGLVELAKIRVRATNDDLSIKELYLSLAQDGVVMTPTIAAQVARLVNEVQLVDSTGKVLATGTVLTEGSMTFVKFSSVTEAMVARDTEMILTVKAAVSQLSEVSDSGLKLVVGLGSASTDVDVNTAADNTIVAEGSTQTLEDVSESNVTTSVAMSKADLITSGKLVVAANSVSDAGAGKVKFTVTNNGRDTVLLNNMVVKSSTGTVTLYKGDTASESERISATGASATSGAPISVSSLATTVEIAAGQTVTILADFDGTVTGDNNTINVSVNDISYTDKVKNTFSGVTPISSIATYKGTGLPASTSFSRSAGTY